MGCTQVGSTQGRDRKRWPVMAVKPLSRPSCSEKQKALGSARLSSKVRTWCHGLSFAGRCEAPVGAQGCSSLNAESPRKPASLPFLRQCPLRVWAPRPSWGLSGPLCVVWWVFPGYRLEGCLALAHISARAVSPPSWALRRPPWWPVASLPGCGIG